MTADAFASGFPSGYFVVRNAATGRLLDIAWGSVEDGTEIILWPEKESSLVETFRKPDADNQVFFIDTSGALCSKLSGHAIDVEGGQLVLRHRRPITHPFPNKYSHPLPRFSYSETTAQISIAFEHDPAYPDNPSSNVAWLNKAHILTSIPRRKPRTFVDDASQFLTTAISTPFSYLKRGSAATSPSTPVFTAEDVMRGDIDLNEEEVVEEERGEEAEVDDDPEPMRKVIVHDVSRSEADGTTELNDQAKLRRRWQVIPLRKSNARRLV